MLVVRLSLYIFSYKWFQTRQNSSLVLQIKEVTSFPQVKKTFCGFRSVVTTYSSVFSLPSHSFNFFCRTPFCVNHLKGFKKKMYWQLILNSGRYQSFAYRVPCPVLTSSTGLVSFSAEWGPVWCCSCVCQSPDTQQPASLSLPPVFSYCQQFHWFETSTFHNYA